MSHVWPHGAAGSRRRALFTAALLSGFVVVCTSCSPYPIYNTSPTRGDKPEAATGSSGETTADAESNPRATGDQPVDQPSAVDPRVFTRIVEAYLGSPYKRGGNDRYGIDCSNLVSVIYREYSGTRVPSSTRGLYHLPHTVLPEDLVVGDLVFFDLGARSPSHVGVYMGEGKFAHASETEGVVISSLDAPPYRNAFVGARRVLSALRTEE
jgi:cell wall-associated NlpC family hydrolase